MHRTLFAFALVSLGFLAGGVHTVEGENTTQWNSDPLPELNYYYWAWSNSAFDPHIYNNDGVPLDTTSDHCLTNPGAPDEGCGWAKGLEQGTLVSIDYNARLVNDDTGVEIMDGTTVPVGTRVRLEALPHNDTDISWFGSGASSDSPTGRWVANAGPVALSCNIEDFLIEYAPVSIYTLLNVDPPSNGLVSSTNASCVGNVCTLGSEGTATFNFQFSSTEGKFYYRFKDGGDCFAFNAPMREGQIPINNFWGPPGGNYCEGHNCVSGPDYEVSVPPQTISFSLDVVDPTVPPATPSLTLPGTGTMGVPVSYSCTVGTSDTGNARCMIDLDEDGVSDTHLPSGAAPYAPVGSLLEFSYTWNATGTYSVQAIAEDDNNIQSAWSPYSDIVISEAPCAADSFGYCDLPLTPSGAGSAPSCTGAEGSCNYSCLNGVWTEAVPNTCEPPTIDSFEICTADLSSCVGAGQTLVTDINTPLTVSWNSSHADLCTAILGDNFETGNDVDGSDTTGINSGALPGVTSGPYRIGCSYGGGTPVTATVYYSTNATLPILSASQTVVRRGQSVTLNWNTNNGDETSCTLEGPGIPADVLQVDATGDSQTGSIDVPIQGRSTYTLTCPAGASVKTIEIIPTSWE